MRPLGRNIIVAPIEEQELKHGTLTLVQADTSREKPTRGMVMVVADEVASILAEGEQVMFSKYSGSDFDHEGERYTLLNIDEVLAVV